MPTIPSHHAEGDTGHTNDHNSIADVLTSQAAQITAVQSALAALPATYMEQAGGNTYGGGNTITVTNPSGVADTVTIPAGSRDGSAYVRTVTYGGRRTFGLDSYGQLRVNSAGDNVVPAEFYGDSSQTANLLNMRKGGVSGTIVASFDANGNLAAPNVTPGAWTALTLASGALTNNFGNIPAYRLVGDRVELRGQVKKVDNSNFATSPQDVGTLPGGFVPPQTHYFIVGAAFVSDEGYVRMEVNPSGLIRFFFRSSTYQPGWISIDNIQFSRTA